MDKVGEFINKINELENEYGLKLEFYIEEVENRGWDGEVFSIGHSVYLDLINKKGYTVANLARKDGKFSTDDQGQYEMCYRGASRKREMD